MLDSQAQSCLKSEIKYCVSGNDTWTYNLTIKYSTFSW